MVEFYRWSFPCLTAVLYTGGALIHLIRVLTGFSPTESPLFIDWVIALAALYGGFGFLIYFRAFGPCRNWRRAVVAIMVFHLLASAVVHIYIIVTQSHAILGIFPVAYSTAAFFAFLGLAWVAATSRASVVATS
ncbi:MAG: hypothetical protein ACYS15_13575 [Planctomycetota bacterium]|jgi:hypothetical protein